MSIKNNYNQKMTIVEYKDAHNIVVEFEDGTKVKNEYKNFIKGLIKNPSTTTCYHGTKLDSYKTWRSMIRRATDKKYKDKNPTYKNVTVCKEWETFENFKKWWDENYYEINGETMMVDKDWLSKNNKIYSPDTCIIVPGFINNLIISNNNKRGLPTGIYSSGKNYYIRCKHYNKKILKGGFKYVKDAVLEYIRIKEELIKEIAEEYKDKIPEKVYNAMINYQISIFDL